MLEVVKLVKPSSDFEPVSSHCELSVTVVVLPEIQVIVTNKLKALNVPAVTVYDPAFATRPTLRQDMSWMPLTPPLVRSHFCVLFVSHDFPTNKSFPGP